MKPLRIVFMGTPDFAVGILDAIFTHKYSVVGVITVADKPAGRGQKVKYSAVKEYALAHQLPLLQPTNLKDESFLTELAALNANLQVVVAFRMLPKVVWAMPQYGTFNLHASLLPQYRGAAPINWAIINGETETGVTSFFIDDKIDTGAMLLHAKTPIGLNETAGELHDRLMELGAQTVIETLQLIAKDNPQTQVQVDSSELKTAHKLNKENCKIDWTQPGQSIHNLIRGLSPYPVAWCHLFNNKQESAIKIYSAQFELEQHQLNVGTLIVDKKTLKVAVCNGFVSLLQVQLPGKNKMMVSDLLNGYTLDHTARLY
ncbi:MAG: methionyl-tRNA formyltransferase [Flavobacterium sp.]|nr:methionyl-tRNA formyltransferase [Flavobacterium sp.]